MKVFMTTAIKKAITTSMGRSVRWETMRRIRPGFLGAWEEAGAFIAGVAGARSSVDSTFPWAQVSPLQDRKVGRGPNQDEGVADDLAYPHRAEVA